ncbi:hypothetical protein DM02DRAFT_349634 [Periconia macrospinosa]|uniref:Aflatoxin regulatory protein domain-containing protein n=1 Tax=Periconia macrospinosa TaxID=97972 RepID=A0A2V1EAL9_9PLEO|nr:hypothetical protein DM02DRAFT_349634 [Periconia macrospinosa]
MRDVSPASSCGPLATRPDMIPRTAAAYASESSPEPSDPFFFGPATPEYHFQDAYVGPNFEGSQSPAYSDTGSFVNSWSGDDHMMFHNNSPEIFNPVPQFPHNPPSYGNHVRTTSVQSQPEMYAPINNVSSPPLSSPQYFGMQQQQQLPVFSPSKLVTSPPPMVSAPLPTPPSSATTPNHDCTQFAFQTLNSLYSPPTTQPNSGDFSTSSNGIPTLDTVLSTNKSAVDKLFVLLGCPCSANPHFSTTIAFTIVKILSWYQAISGAKPSPGESSVTQMEIFTHTPISLGEFKLEGEDEHTLRTQLVLTELRKVEKLIDKFSERYCKSASLADTGIDGGVYGALEQLLRTRVRDTFKVTMKTAPEEVKRQLASRTQNRARNYTL